MTRKFPLFIDLTDKKVLIAGAGTIALRRASVLLQFGALVTLVAPEAGDLPEGVRYLKKKYESRDLEGACLAVAATDDREVNRRVGLDAKAMGIPVSVADAQEECSFFFPAVCLNDPMVAGVVSDGTDHRKTARAARAIRKCLEEV